LIEVDGTLPQNLHYKWSKKNKPIARVPQEETVRLKVPDCFASQLTENSTLSDFIKLDPSLTDGASGPIYVEGAQPGDTLEIDIDEVKTGSWGCSMSEGHFGLLRDRFPDNFTIWEMHDGYALSRSGLLKGIRVPVNPFLGIMGVAPGEGEFGMIPPQAFGGNMDNRLLTAGAKLFLPVQTEGALFSAGDPHAAQGDGESGGTGIEINATATLRFRVLKDLHIRYPRAIVTVDSRPHLLAMGVSEDLYTASQLAMEGMIDELGRHGISGGEGYTLCSLAGDLRISGIVDDPTRVVSMVVPMDILRRN
jgi:acetamidase/formamidase